MFIIFFVLARKTHELCVYLEISLQPPLGLLNFTTDLFFLLKVIVSFLDSTLQLDFQL